MKHMSFAAVAVLFSSPLLAHGGGSLPMDAITTARTGAGIVAEVAGRLRLMHLLLVLPRVKSITRTAQPLGPRELRLSGGVTLAMPHDVTGTETP